MILAFGLGMLWMTLIGVQTKLFVATKNEWLLLFWVFITSIIWGYLVRVIVLDESVIISYSIGTAVGAKLSLRLSDIMERKNK